MKALILIITLCCIVTCCKGNSTDKKQLTVNVLYDQYDDATLRMIREQILPVSKLLGNYVYFDLIPYGSTTTFTTKKGKIVFRCLNGAVGCIELKMQACGQKYSTYESSLEFIACTQNSTTPETSGKLCAHKLGIDFENIKKCLRGNEGTKLLALNGRRSYSFKPQYFCTPWTIWNGKNIDDECPEIKNLLSRVCSFLKDPKPAPCNEVQF